jgi:hypothetical protein
MNERKHWLDEPRHVRLLWRLFLGMLAATVVAELAVSLHAHFGVDGLFAFHGVYGFLACLAMILVAKGLGALLKRPDDYYGGGDD